MNLFTQQKQTQRRALWLPRRRREEWNGWGVWAKQIQTIAFKMDKQWVPHCIAQ